MRRIRIAAASVMVAAGLIGAVAAPASAAKPDNFGTCVKNGVLDPSSSILGPQNAQAVESSGTGGGIETAIDRRGAGPHFPLGGVGCSEDV